MSERPLWQVSVATSREAEEAVAELLQRQFKQAVSSYTAEGSGATTVSILLPKPLDSGSKSGLAAGLSTIRSCGLEISPAKITCRKVRRKDWAESWKKHFKPIEVGPALLVKPSWSPRKARRGQAVVVLEPGLSFGTGQHATTAFCLRQLIAARKPGTRQSFLDIGTGSGILAIAAAKLGYSPVRALDVDPEAVRVAAENARQNRVAVTVRREDLSRQPKRSARRFDVVCANLTADLLLCERRKIVNQLRPGGRLILSGILTTEFDEVEAACAGVGLRLRESQTEGSWQSGTFSSALG